LYDDRLNRHRVNKGSNEMSSLFHGSALCEVDPDGNVYIPAFLDEAIDDGSNDLLVSKHGADGCLVGYGRRHLDELQARADARRIAEEVRGDDARNHYRRVRRTFGIVDKMPRSGAKIQIPAAMRHLGRIGGLALFIGAGDSFEIWNPYLAVENEDEQFRDLAAFLVKARGNSNHASGGH
jgi:MraZ protein